MRKTIYGALLATGAAFAVLATANFADAAQNYRRDGWFWNYNDERWCLTQDDLTPRDCAYRTFEQCNYSRNGTGGSCSENPRYVEQAPQRKRAKRIIR
jgi:hypothetical protein